MAYRHYSAERLRDLCMLNSGFEQSEETHIDAIVSFVVFGETREESKNFSYDIITLQIMTDGDIGNQYSQNLFYVDNQPFAGSYIRTQLRVEKSLEVFQHLKQIRDDLHSYFYDKGVMWATHVLLVRPSSICRYTTYREDGVGITQEVYKNRIESARSMFESMFSASIDMKINTNNGETPWVN